MSRHRSTDSETANQPEQLVIVTAVYRGTLPTGWQSMTNFDQEEQLIGNNTLLSHTVSVVDGAIDNPVISSEPDATAATPPMMIFDPAGETPHLAWPDPHTVDVPGSLEPAPIPDDGYEKMESRTNRLLADLKRLGSNTDRTD